MTIYRDQGTDWRLAPATQRYRRPGTYLVLPGLGLDEQVAGLAGGDALARLQGLGAAVRCRDSPHSLPPPVRFPSCPADLQGGEGHGDLGPWLPWPQPRLVDHHPLDALARQLALQHQIHR